MTKAETLRALADRVEKAILPDRELDGAIRKAIHGDFWFCGDEEGAYFCGACTLPSHELTQQPGCGAPLGLHDERTSYPSPWSDDDRLPHYTASLDAALTLVPEGWHVALLTECDEDSNPKCCLIENDDPCRGAVGKGADMILSLCPAALRAHAQEAGE